MAGWRRIPREGAEIVSQDPSCDAAFDAARPYRGKTLLGHFGDLLYMKDADLHKEAAGFLKTMATWVSRAFASRRKGGVPTGELSRFVHPDGVKLDFTRAIIVHLVGLLRKRGLVEADRATNPQFEQLLRAYDIAAQKGGRR